MTAMREAPQKNSSIDLHTIALQAMTNYGFVPLFSQAVVREVHGFAANHLEVKTRSAQLLDLRALPWSSIDNIDSQDLDQIEFVERAPNLEIRVLVAIADVDAYVEKSTATDRHAHQNGTSVYTGVEVFPMLPDRLSAGLTSLKEGEDRLAVVMEYFVLKDGSVRCSDVFRALVHNKAKLVYESVGEWLEERGPVPEKIVKIQGLEEQLRLQSEAAERMRQWRLAQGALEVETIEASPIMQDGSVVDLVVKVKNAARILIENFMIAANGTMVWFLERNGIPMIQRVVRVPERWSRIRDVALELGYQLPEDPDPKALSEFMLAQGKKDPDHFPDLSLTIIKLLGQGEYVLAEPDKSKIGHFGLAVQDYTHSTAPNRRYVDVIIQRLMKSVIEKEPVPYTRTELASIADWCTERSASARKVERFMRKVAAAMLLRKRIGEVFEAIVTGASAKGVYVRLESIPAEGRVISAETGLDVGQKCLVKLVSLDPEHGYIDFERVKSRKS